MFFYSGQLEEAGVHGSKGYLKLETTMFKKILHGTSFEGLKVSGLQGSWKKAKVWHCMVRSVTL